LLATILEPTDGTAVVNGHDVVDSLKKCARPLDSFLAALRSIRASLLRKWSSILGRLNGLDEATLKKRVDEIFNGWT